MGTQSQSEQEIPADILAAISGEAELLEPCDFFAIRDFELTEGNGMADMPSFCYF